MQVISANVQTLWHKHKYFEEQCVPQQVDVLMLQETKMAGGYCETQQYHRFYSDADRHWGVAIWLGKESPANGRRVRISRENTTVGISEPRIIAVHVHAGGVKLLLLSVHVPQQSRPSEERYEVLGKLR